jgi:hypothetical protein
MINTVEKKYDNENNFVCYNVVTTDNLHISVPLDEANKDYVAVQEWIADGGTVIDNG